MPYGLVLHHTSRLPPSMTIGTAVALIRSREETRLPQAAATPVTTLGNLITDSSVNGTLTEFRPKRRPAHRRDVPIRRPPPAFRASITLRAQPRSSTTGKPRGVRAFATSRRLRAAAASHAQEDRASGPLTIKVRGARLAGLREPASQGRHGRRPRRRPRTEGQKAARDRQFRVAVPHMDRVAPG